MKSVTYADDPVINEILVGHNLKFSSPASLLRAKLIKDRKE